jgi:uncharacterized membrane protein
MDEGLPCRFVLVFGLLLGGSLVFLSPPYSVPDEREHFYRAYHCSLGKLYACKRDGRTGDDLPSSLTETSQAIMGEAHEDAEFSISWAKIKRAWDIPLDPKRRQFTAFSNTALYSPVPYVPQAAAIWAAGFWQPPPLAMLYLARMAGLAVYLLSAALAVRFAPVLKWTLALVALMPMSVYLAASCSADTAAIGLALLIVALILKLILGSQTPSRRGLLVLGLLLAALGLSKQAYLGVALLLLATPGKKFSSPVRRWLTIAALIGVPLAVDVAWMYSLRGLYVPMRADIDPAAQLRWMWDHPWSYASGLGKALYRLETYGRLIGYFGWAKVSLPKWICWSYWAALGTTAVLDAGKPPSLGLAVKTAALATYVFTAAVVATFLHLSWDAVGTKGVPGMQPRYFLPIIPLLLLPLRGGPKWVSSRFAQAVLPVAAISIAALAAGCTWWTLVRRYYW